MLALFLLAATAYVVPVVPNAVTIPLLTAGDSVNGYRMAGFPDGLGAYDNGDGTFTLLMNHEIGGGAGAIRAHGESGAFVSKWTIRKSDLQVMRGEDLIQRVVLWNRGFNSYDPPSKGIRLNRFCSATLVPEYGIFLTGEETFEGRVFAHALDGISYELPRFGRAQWENAVMHPAAEKTIVIGLDDLQNGHVYVYVGNKTSSGPAIERAGLTNGTLYVVQVAGSRFGLIPMGNVSNESGTSQRNLAGSLGGTRWERPEDGAWDPNHPNDFYFVTTATLNGRSRLWRLRFDSLELPSAGGTLDMLLDGTEGPRMMDNLVVRAAGDVFIQEDPGAVIARIWRYDPATDRVEVVAQHLAPGEESSGIIDVAGILGEGWMLFDVQTHRPAGPEILDGGQLLAMRYPVTRRRSAGH